MLEDIIKTLDTKQLMYLSILIGKRYIEILEVEEAKGKRKNIIHA